MLLDTKKVFITGGTGGIGKPLVRFLREAGAKVHVYDQKQNGDLAVHVDETVRSLREESPDILINMAGFNDFNYAEKQDYESLIRLNLLVPMRLCQAVLPGMKARGKGQIVNIGSMTGLIPLPHLTGYVAAKSGLRGFTDSLRRELAGTGISVTHIVPRAVATGMNKGTRAEINKRTGVHHDDPETVAKRIFTAVLRKEKEVRFGWPERCYAFLNAVTPFIIDLGLEKNRKIGEEILDAEAVQDDRHAGERSLNTI